MEIKQINSPSGRQYQVGEKRYPSITTILNRTKDKSGLDSWRERVGNQVADHIMHTSMDIGTATHEMIERYLNKEDPYTPLPPLLVQAHFNNLKKYLKKMGAVHGIEKRLYSDTLGVAGTCDCICEYDGKLSIVDYKTKRTLQNIDWLEDYFIQTTAYAIMWAEHFVQEIQQLVILISSEDGMSQEVIRHPHDYVTSLRRRINDFNR